MRNDNQNQDCQVMPVTWRLRVYRLEASIRQNWLAWLIIGASVAAAIGIIVALAIASFLYQIGFALNLQ